MKLARVFAATGQRWTLQGGQQVANLQVANKNGNWQQVIDRINLN